MGYKHQESLVLKFCSLIFFFFSEELGNGTEHRICLNKNNFCALAISLKNLWKTDKEIQIQHWSITSVDQCVQA